jgi:hypothetical protein
VSAAPIGGWTSGECVVFHEVWDGRVWAARPMTVVQDEGDALALWFPRGTPWRAPTTPPTRPRAATRGERLATCAARGEWVFAEAIWDVDTLMLMRAGDWYAVWVSWLPSGAHWGWYVNLQEPFRRTRGGVETMDLVLDVIVDPDGTWRWKDEDELDEFVRQGVFDPELAERLRRKALGVVERARRREPPFDESWLHWRPPAAWSPPHLPANWDARCR